MAKRRKKGPSHTPKAEDRHWYGNRQAARAAKSATRTGTATVGSRRTPSSSAPAERTGRRSAPEGPELVTGRNPVVEALRAGIPASALYVMTGASDDRVRESIKLATDAGVPLLEAGRTELDRMTDRAVHQGIVLQVPEYRYAHPDDLLQRGTPQLIVALDGVTDPRNLGAIVRSAAAFGANGVLVPERRAAGVTAGAWKTSAGTLASVPVARATNLVRTLKSYQNAGLFVAGLDARGAVGVGDLEAASGPLVLVVGSEGKGLSRLVAETCDLLINIPMGPKAESLNAGVAAGIAMYEISRRRS
ncbi:23S rRNA (guanosine(2251)-2'-O)-methyltransferase RlmB [Actinoallomurus rhizosphaericola]|uniref:23S rRNA (guanosine(2251)-2'-O)-methyltransferase RlmB n=1 Tax=Actinoallomurus rhizosphaericola TaxID=2952536 RepID=UPI0020916043|nr:23S rRNA (guanosine(2251)-2'-O)-methyltransferase RlmB [Actinoallomurus rhizosphaericola]MCO5993200.1 23S rRNA (guanosine(2251)-2'-O)-methyltransferase RlmB [Actinoallomurus rhizosphaericola]